MGQANQLSSAKQSSTSTRRHASDKTKDVSVKSENQVVDSQEFQQALEMPGLASPKAILQLQRAAGNRAVQRLLNKQTIQAKLRVGAAHDRYEQEADQVASQVMRTPESAATSEILPENDTPLQRKPIAISPVIQRAATAEEGFEAGDAVESQLALNQGRGNSLPKDTRSFMETRFGADFSGVRVHTGGESVQLNRDLSAQAFIHGQDIYCGENKYNPATGHGQQPLAH